MAQYVLQIGTDLPKDELVDMISGTLVEVNDCREQSGADSDDDDEAIWFSVKREV